MKLLQVIPKELPASTEAVLWAFVTLLIGGIIFLVLYIRKMHNERLRYGRETQEIILKTQDVLLKVVDKNTEAYHGMKASIELNTVATKNGAEQMRGATDRLTTAVDNLNRDMRNER
jgi:hypothetical protein